MRNHLKNGGASKSDGCVIGVKGIILLSLTIIFMFIAICVLSYLLYRLKYGKYKIKIYSSPDDVGTSKEYIRQPSGELDPIPMKKISYESPFKQTDILTMVDTDVKEQASRADSKPLTPKPARLDYMKTANGTKLPMQPVITPDQMNKVCNEVLSKMKRNQSTSLTHLNELIKSKNNEERTNDDDLEEYDILPTPKKIASGRTQDMDVYDSPPMGNNNHDSDDEPQDYYDNVPIREDLYQNARFVHDTLQS